MGVEPTTVGLKVQRSTTELTGLGYLLDWLKIILHFYKTRFYVWGKLQAFAPSKRFQSWRFVVGTIPLVPLLYTIITRTSDYRHHWQDVCVGALFGILGAWVCYRLYYPELSSVYCHYSYRQQYRMF